MGLAAIVRSAVKIANKATADLQVTVEHEAWIGQDAYGKPSYSYPYDRKALVEYGGKPVRTAQDEAVVPLATLTFLSPIDANGADGRQDPVDPRDRFTLPDGRVGKVIVVSPNMADPAADPSAPYLLEVILG